MNFDGTLTREDRVFLQDNFQIYDPDSGGFHTDFGVLQGRKVIIIGEKHQRGVSEEMHNAFLKRFGTNRDCLLIENYPPDQKMPIQRFPLWPDLPEGITILGSDCRVKDVPLENLQKFFLLQQQLTQIMMQTPLAMQRDQETANVLNAAVENSNVIKKGNAIQFLFQDVVKCLEIWNNTEEVVLRRKIESLRLPDSLKIIESNRGLAQTIIKAAETFRIVIAIWGMGHLIDRCELYQLLQKHRISYVVLVPSKNRAEQIKQEKKARRTCTLQSSYSDKISLVVNDIPILVSSISYFHREIRRIIQTKHKGEKINVSVQWLRNNPYKRNIPANTAIYFENAPIGDKVDEYLNSDDFPLMKVLEPLCLISQREINIDSAPTARFKWKSTRHPFTFEPLVKIKYDQMIELSSERLVRTTLKDLVAQMQLRRLDCFEIEASVPIYLEGYSRDKIRRLFANIDINFPKELSEHAPPSTTLTLIGNYIINYDLNNGIIVIEGSASLKFVITPKEGP